MRNLKKILALVLALVMSLSLMATAGAGSFQDVTDDNPYKTAIDVLDQLKVFQGFEDGSFKPTDTLNRAQAAVLVYRIATGDVEGKQVDNYTYMAQSKFTDLDGYNWAKGYINYCQNAGIVVGTDATHFNPGGKVTGYQLLVMLLRTLGYGKAGEFADPKGWELQTASIAEREGITKYITNGDFGASAPRQMVAEILFRGLLTETVTYSQLTSGGYTKSGETLGKRELDLEELEGVVMANEYASLTSSVTAKDGKTELLSDGKTYTLNTTTTLDDIGENRHAYIQNSTVLYMEDVGNTTEESTDAEKVSDILSRAGIADGGENFVNFDRLSTWTSPWKIKYEVNLGPVANLKTPAADGIARIAAAVEDGRTLGFILPDATTFDQYGNPTAFDPDLGDGEYSLVASAEGSPYKFDLVYSKSFKIRQEIGPVHQSNIELIFNIADEDSKGYIDGEVYYGTSSLDDVSDELTLEQFIEKCIDDTYDVNIKSNDNGNWVKVIDNNGDGVAEYVFKVIYTIAQVSKVKDDAYTLDVKNHTLWNEDVWPYEECDIDDLNTLTSQKVVANGDMETGTVVYYAIIDGKAQAYPTTVVPSVNIEKYVRKTETVTTTDGDDYIKSDVCEHIEDEAYDAAPELLAGKVNYDLFLVRGDYLGAFVKSSLESDYKLITDGWFDSRKNADEYAVRVYDEESERADKQEIVDITANGDLFIDRDVWNVDHTVDNNDWGALKYLGGTYGEIARSDVPVHVHATAGESVVIDGAALNGGKILCKTDAAGNSEHWFIKDGTPYNVIKTTVAAITADGTILPVENSSVTGRYNHAMIDLPDLSKVPTRAAVDGEVYYTQTGSDTAYDQRWEDGRGNAEAVTVRAQSSTVYYVVYPSNTDSGVMVTKSVGYSKAPDVKAWNDKGWVEDIYAVGTLRTADNDIDDDNPEYTADIVVIELNNYENDKEIVLVLDDAVKLSDTRYRELVVITADGKLETRTINWRNSFLAYDGDSSVNTKWVEPGLYYMTTTSEKDVYALQGQLNHDEIASEGGYTTGLVERVNWTNDKYVVIDPYFWQGTPTDPSLYGVNDGEDQFDLTAETPLFRVSYDDPARYDTYGTANVDEGVGADWDEDFLSAAVDVVNKSYPKAALVRDTNDGDIHNERYYNYNRVLIHHDGKGNVVYAVSFDKLADESGITADNNALVSSYNYAMTVWNNVKPATAKDTNIYIPLEIRAADGEEVTVEGVDEVEYDETRTGRELKLPGEGFFQIKVTVGEDVDIDSIIINAPGCTREGIKVDEDGAYIITFRYTKPQTRTVAAVEDTNVIATVQYVQETIIAAFDEIVEDGVVNDKEAYDELMAALEIYAENEVPGQTVAADAETEIKEAVAAAEGEAAEELAAAKNAALVAISETLSVAEPYWANDPMGWKALTAEIDAIKTEIESAEDIETVTAKKAEALSKITAPATITQDEINENLGASAMLYEAVDAIGVPGEKKIIISTESAPTGYTMTQLLATDELIKAALAWNDTADEITGSGTAADPWTSTKSEGRKYVKDTETPGEGQLKASDFIKNTLGKYLQGKDESFSDDTKLFFAVLDTVAAGIDPSDVKGATVLTQPITQGMLDENGIFVTKFYGTEVTFTVDCSGIQW